MQGCCDVKNVKAAVATLQGMLECEAFRELMHISPIYCCMTILPHLHISLQGRQSRLGDAQRVALASVFAMPKRLKVHGLTELEEKE